MANAYSSVNREMTADQVKWNVAVANRILAKEKVVDAFGHVSQRSPWNGETFLIARSMAPALVTRGDIVELDLNGNNIDPSGAPSYLERFLHAEIYRARPEVHAIVHSHSPSMLPFASVPGVSLRCISHLTGFLGEKPPVFEIRDTAGDSTDLLVRNSSLGRALTACLGDHSIVLMRGHGSTVVGRTLPEAVFHAVYAEVNARVQYHAMQLGSPSYLSAGEMAEAAKSTAGAMHRAWELWVANIRREEGSTL